MSIPLRLPAAVAAAVTRFRDLVRARFDGRLQELRLFGSYARGEAHEDSDVDVLVVIDDLTDEERRQVFDLAYDAASGDRSNWVVLNPLPYSTAKARELRERERLLLRDIDEEGIAL